MSAAFKQQWMQTDDAARELWRVAESGDVAELERLLPQVRDINARNKYGMTALMRAAYHGREEMVRSLLDHGADPNLVRNDRFTALALAAFFGHTGTVKILVEHGAKKEAVTRCGTSAYMWATARTFDEAARCLRAQPVRRLRAEAPPTLQTQPTRPTAVPIRKAPIIAEPAPPRPVEVKTLKEPPEIWDLVHEVPRDFNPRSAFVSRLASMKLGSALVAVLIVCAMCAGGFWLLRRSQAHNLERNAAANQSVTQTNPPANVVNPQPEPVVNAPAPEVSDVPPAEIVNNHLVLDERASSSRKMRLLTRQSRIRTPSSEEVVESAPVKEVAAPPAVASPQFESRSSAESPAKSKPALSPQLITPAKNAPPKAKVIQWP